MIIELDIQLSTMNFLLSSTYHGFHDDVIKLEELAGLRFVWDARIFIADLIPAPWPSPPSLGQAHSEPTQPGTLRQHQPDGFCGPRDDVIISPHFEIK